MKAFRFQSIVAFVAFPPESIRICFLFLNMQSKITQHKKSYAKAFGCFWHFTIKFVISVIRLVGVIEAA